MNRDEQVLRNLDLVESFLHEIIDAPEMLDGIPDRTNMILMPSEDEELADANMKSAQALMRCPRCGSQMKPVGTELDQGHREGVYLQPVCS